MADIEVTVVARFQGDRQPEESEWRELVEDMWLGQLLDVEEEDV